MLLSLCTGLLFTFGPVSEAIFPLFTGVKAAIVKVGVDHTDIIVTGTKARSCFLVAVSSEVLIDGHWVVGSATFENQDGTPLKIEQQRIATGAPFVRQVRVMPSGSQIKIKVESRCHPLWVTTQDLIEVDVQYLYQVSPHAKP